MNANTLKPMFFIIIVLLFMPQQNQASKIRSGIGYETFIVTSFRLIQLGFEEQAYIKNEIAKDENDYIRNSNENNPGYYLMPPSGEEKGVDSGERDFLEKILRSYLNQNYYDSTILVYANNIFLTSLGRNEFYFDIYSNDVHFLFSGWYGRFVHIMVFTDFDSKKSFAARAQRFFNLPKLNTDEITYAEEIRKGNVHDFFYAYVGDGFRLAGYPFLQSVSEEEISYEYNVLDLTIYPREQKDEK